VLAGTSPRRNRPPDNFPAAILSRFIHFWAAPKDIRSGKTLDVPARRVAAFRVGKELKRALYKPKKG
jgi:hypothetical protein